MRSTAAIPQQPNSAPTRAPLPPAWWPSHCTEMSSRSRAMADRQYELVYILPPDTTEQQVTELHGQLEAVVSRLHGQIEKTENWGRKRLAYEIGHHKEGVYVL